MSNECSNQLVVVGLISDLAHFKRATCIYRSHDDREVELCTDKHIPLLDSKGMSREVRALACNCVSNASLEVKDSETGYGCMDFGFCTPWEPPIGFVCKVSTLFPALEFHLTYMEEGVGFAGKVTYLAGKLINKVHVEYMESDDYFKEYLARPELDPWKDGLFQNSVATMPTRDPAPVDTIADKVAD